MSQLAYLSNICILNKQGTFQNKTEWNYGTQILYKLNLSIRWQMPTIMRISFNSHSISKMRFSFSSFLGNSWKNRSANWLVFNGIILRILNIVVVFLCLSSSYVCWETSSLLNRSVNSKNRGLFIRGVIH